MARSHRLPVAKAVRPTGLIKPLIDWNVDINGNIPLRRVPRVFPVVSHHSRYCLLPEDNAVPVGPPLFRSHLAGYEVTAGVPTISQLLEILLHV